MRAIAPPARAAHPIADLQRYIAPRIRRRAVRLDMALLVTFLLLLYGIAGHEQSDPTRPLYNIVIWYGTYVITLWGFVVERKTAARLFVKALPVLAIVGFCVLSVTWADYPDIALKRVIELVCSTAAAYLIVCRFKLRDFLKGVSIAIILAAFVSLLEVLFWPERGVMHDGYPGAWRGIFAHKNGLGQAMAFGLVTLGLVASMRDSPIRRRKLLWPGALLCAIMLGATESATSFVTFGILASILGCFMLWRSSLSRPVVLAALAGVAGLYAVAIMNVNILIESLGRDMTLTGRTEIWQVVLDGIAKRPWLGYGYTMFWQPDGSGAAYIPVVLSWMPYSAHNGLLELCLNVGYVGVGIFSVALALALWQTGRAAVSERSMAWVWPLISVISLIFANCLEATVVAFNDVDWVFFIAASLYASDRMLRRGNAAATGAVRVLSVAEPPASGVPFYVAPRAGGRRNTD